MEISKLRPGMNHVDVEGKITDVSEPRQIRTKFGHQISLTTATLEDDSGDIKITLWGDQSNGITEGVQIKVENGFTKEFQGNLQLGVGKNGKITIVE